MQSCTNNTIIRCLRLPPCWYSLSVCNQEYSRECSRNSHSFGCTYSDRLVGTRIVSSYSVYLCYFFCSVCNFVKYLHYSCIILDYAQIIPE